MTIRELAKLLEPRVARWPEWKRRAALAGLFTEDEKAAGERDTVGPWPTRPPIN